jgi:nuclear GTP-binding protein
MAKGVKGKRMGLKHSTRGLVGVMRNFREERQNASKAHRTNARNSKVAAARGMEAPAQIHALTKSAARRQKAFAKQARAQPDEAAADGKARGADPGALVVSQTGRQRSFHKELDRVIAMSDVLLEVLDARDPLGCRCAALETAVLEHRGAPKRIVIVLNKADLVPADNLDAWIRYLKRFHPVVAFKATDLGARRRAHGPGAQPTSLPPAALLAEEQGLGLPPLAKVAGVQTVDDLIGLLKDYSRSDKTMLALTVGVVGYPNVGKSSIINALKRSRAVTTGAMPGVTRSLQVVALDRKLKLIDCPGVVFSKPTSEDEAAQMVLRSALKVDTPLDPAVLVDALLRRCERSALRDHFGIGDFDNATELLALIALKRGLLRKGGKVDQALAARVLVQEWTTSAISYHTPVPRAVDEPDAGAAILTGGLAPAFDLNALDKPKVEVLPGARSNKRAREETPAPALSVVGAAAAMAEEQAEQSDEESDDDPSELGAGTMEDEASQAALLAGLRAGSRRKAHDPDPTDPNLIRKEPLARSKVRQRARTRTRPAQPASARDCERWRARAAAAACSPSPSLTPPRPPPLPLL